jgi:Ca2+-binding EF-hand superfamily protein
MRPRPRFDSDGDGAVTAAEFEQGFARRFARADANGDGTVTTEELAASRRHRN